MNKKKGRGGGVSNTTPTEHAQYERHKTSADANDIIIIYNLLHEVSPKILTQFKELHPKASTERQVSWVGFTLLTQCFAEFSS